MFGLGTEVKKSGPWFDARAGHIIDNFADDAEEEVADQGLDMLQRHMHTSFRRPTGFYEAHTKVRKRGAFQEISDGGVVYGPWLEGVGSKNRTTRFKGYWIYRKTHATLERKAGGIAERLLKRKYLWRLR